MTTPTAPYINLDDELNFIEEHMTRASLYEMLAEEATELAQASLKMARIIREENPTPVDPLDAWKSIEEEWNDLYLVNRVLSLTTDYVAMKHKAERWIERLKEKEAKNGNNDGASTIHLGEYPGSSV